jgi:hypothetical protein
MRTLTVCVNHDSLYGNPDSLYDSLMEIPPLSIKTYPSRRKPDILNGTLTANRNLDSLYGTRGSLYGNPDSRY